jgi:hypothetical protein
MTPFNFMQASSMTLATCAYVIAYKYGEVGTAFGVAIGYMTVWVPFGDLGVDAGRRRGEAMSVLPALLRQEAMSDIAWRDEMIRELREALKFYADEKNYPAE